MPCLLVCPAEPVPRYGRNEAFDEVLIAASLASAKPWLSFARRRTWLAGASVIVQGLIAAAALAAARQWPCCQLTRLTAHCAVRLADDCASLPACQPGGAHFFPDELAAGRDSCPLPSPPQCQNKLPIHAKDTVMGNAAQKPFLTAADYLAWEPAQAERHEYIGGELFALAGA